MSEQATEAAIAKTITVGRPREEAFRTFAEEIDAWWPREYALGGEGTERIVLEPREGGRVYEVESDGTEHAWGEVLAYEPPHRLVLAWGLNGSEVEIRFSPDGGGTRVSLEHRGWENLEDGRGRAQYDAGWDTILARFTDAVGASPLVLRKSVRVGCGVEEAFLLYTEGIATWWPLRTHSVAEGQAEAAVFEPGVGGRIYERARGGTVHLWGTVLEWEPPTRFLQTWHPGRDESTRQLVEIRFRPDGGGTRVEIVHTGWDALGPNADEAYRDYDGGWDYVLGRCFAGGAA